MNENVLHPTPGAGLRPAANSELEGPLAGPAGVDREEAGPAGLLLGRGGLTRVCCWRGGACGSGALGLHLALRVGSLAAQQKPEVVRLN